MDNDNGVTDDFVLYIHPTGGWELFIKQPDGFDNYTDVGYYGFVQTPRPCSSGYDVGYFEEFPNETTIIFDDEAKEIVEILKKYNIVYTFDAVKRM